MDRFIQAELKSQGLEPAPLADRITRLRRLAFTLTGLPPESDELKSFLADESPQAWTAAVDRMLASDHFGEHWARHWMDVVRYTDTYGYEWDVAAKGAWRYRDYLVRAFNSDVGFDQLVREQIAGDLLLTPRLNEELGINESLIGPMFYQLGEKRHGDSSEFNGVHQEMLDNKVDALSKSLLATTVSCARCHDHKRDPITQHEYYALAGALLSSRWITNTVDLPTRNQDTIEKLRAVKNQVRQQLADHWTSELGQLNVEQLAALPVVEKVGLEDLRYSWQILQEAGDDAEKLTNTWQTLAGVYRDEAKQRGEKNSQDFTLIADLRNEVPKPWTVDGSGTRQLVGRGDFAISPVERQGDRATLAWRPVHRLDVVQAERCFAQPLFEYTQSAVHQSAGRRWRVCCASYRDRQRLSYRETDLPEIGDGSLAAVFDSPRDVPSDTFSLSM